MDPVTHSRTIRIGEGDSTPFVSVDVTGMEHDPTAAAVLFSMAIGDEAPKVADGVGSVSDIVEDPPGVWSATFNYQWTAPDDTGTVGTFRAWFTVTFAALECGPAGNEACIETFPPDRSLIVEVIRT